MFILSSMTLKSFFYFLTKQKRLILKSTFIKIRYSFILLYCLFSNFGFSILHFFILIDDDLEANPMRPLDSSKYLVKNPYQIFTVYCDQINDISFNAKAILCNLLYLCAFFKLYADFFFFKDFKIV